MPRTDLTKIMEHENFSVYLVNRDRKVKTLTSTLFKNKPQEICESEENINKFVTANIKLMEVLLKRDAWGYFFFDRGDGQIFTKQFCTILLPDGPNVSIHQLSKQRERIKKDSLLFVPILK